MQRVAPWTLPGAYHSRQCRLYKTCSGRKRHAGASRAAADTAKAATPSDAPAPASKYIYEGTYGLPVVRERLLYSDLLRDVRQGKVKGVRWFKDDEAWAIDGPCLVEYTDGTLKQANIPLEDVRMRAALESHGVRQHKLAMVPPASELAPPQELSQTALTALKALPFVTLALIWGMVQAKAIMKGDAADRAQLKRKALAERREVDEQRREDEKILNIAKMVRNKYTDEQIKLDVQRMKMELEEDELAAIIDEARKNERMRQAGSWSLADEEERRAAQRQAEINRSAEDDSESGAGVGRMRSMKIRKARLRNVNRSKMRGRLKNVDDDDIFFDDVAGIDAAKRELAEIVDFFNFPERFAKSGARAPRGVLLYGPPGTGKTLLARAVAGEAEATFVGVNASEFVEMFVGVGAARVRDLFQTARENAPAVIFIDEIDAVGRVRGGSQGNDERDQTLNQMLTEMDGFDERSGIVVIAATNRRDVLDPALIRAGRFDRQVMVGLPSLEGRIDVFKVHLARRKWDAADVRLGELAFETQQYSGAMIANVVNFAALICGRDGRDVITHADLEAALDIERVGTRLPAYTPAVSERLAVVEGATALAATLLPAIEPVVRVSVQPSEKAPLGQTVLKVNEQRELTQLYTKRYLQEQLLMVLAGRAAEKVLLGPDELSSLNVANLGYARRIVQKLVVSNAMADSAVIGPRTVSSPHTSGRRDMQQIITSRTSIETLTAADFEMEARLQEAEAAVTAMLERNRTCLEVIIRKLANPPYEMTGDELRDLVAAHGHPDDLQRRDEALSHEAFI